jgi:hypothetical protein
VAEKVHIWAQGVAQEVNGARGQSLLLMIRKREITGLPRLLPLTTG